MSAGKFKSQYAYISRNKNKYAKYARDRYQKVKQDPEKWAALRSRRKRWEAENRNNLRIKQRENKRLRKLRAVELLGGKCVDCNQTFPPYVYDFHHLDATQKDRDPSKLLGLSWERIERELLNCVLLCANCHRIRHHNWEENNKNV